MSKPRQSDREQGGKSQMRRTIILGFLLCVSGALGIAQSIPAKRPQSSQLTLPGPQKHSPPSEPAPPGTIEGFVYWDTASVTHVPASSCSGLAVTVAVGDSSGRKSTSYKPLATLTNNFKYVGQVKQFLVGSNIKVYDVCTYGYDHVPVGPDLRVTVLAEGSSPTQAGPFSPASAPQIDPVGPITIINGQCNMLPRIVNPTASDLLSHWGSCQNMAYDVNFMMEPTKQVLNNRGAGVSLRAGQQTGLLNNKPQQGMLASGTGSSAQGQSTDGGLLGNRAASSSITDGTRQNYASTTRQSGTLNSSGGVLTNADVIKIVKARVPESIVVQSIQSARGNFDLSSAGCHALQRANVSAIIVVAMGNGSVRPCPEITGTGGLNGQGPTDHNRRSITDITNRGTSAPAKPGSKVELNPQPLPPRQGLTNADVIRMMNQGLPESVIIHSIQSANKQFDLSREGLQSLQQAHVAPAILAAMCDGSVHSCDAITRTGSTPAATPGGKGTRSAGTALKPIKLPAPTAPRKVTNPRLGQQNASIMAVLEQQRQAAQQEFAAMKAAVRSTASAASARTPALSTNFRGNAPMSGLAPGQTQSAPGNAASSIATLPFFNSLPITCANDPTPRVLHVSGGQAPTVFTPEAKYNQYTIVGCSFGQSQQGNSAYIFGPNGFQANLNIDFWSENGITAHLDPSLAGVLDQNNITLVISPTGKQQIQKQGFTFYAARGMPNPDGSDQEVALPYDSMAQPSVTRFEINNFLDGFDQLPSNATSVFPSFSFNGTPVVGWIFRYLYGHADRIAALRSHDCFINDVGFDGKDCTWPDFQKLPRNDTWDFNKMAPGFAISSYSLYYDDIDPSTLCGGLIDLNSDGSLIGQWNFDLNQQNQIVVTWPMYDCYFSEFGTRDSFADLSSYGVAVWVLGPRCVNPWTGQKDQSCIAKLKQILG
jgi:hypothetical protein